MHDCFAYTYSLCYNKQKSRNWGENCMKAQGLLFKARETVLTSTQASLATSFRVGMVFHSFSDVLWKVSGFLDIIVCLWKRLHTKKYISYSKEKVNINYKRLKIRDTIINYPQEIAEVSENIDEILEKCYKISKKIQTIAKQLPEIKKWLMRLG